jgi:small subunit ribosomal protein S20
VAHHESAKKRIRRNGRANIQNSQYLSSVRTAVKKFRAAVVGVAEGNFDKAKVSPLFINAQSLLAKAASKGVLHKNNVTRKIARLSKLLRAVETGTVVEVTGASKKAKASKTRAKTVKAAAPKAAKAAKPAVAKKTTTAKKTVAKKK